MSVDIIFLLGNLIVVLISVFSINYCQLKYLNLSEKIFVRRILGFSLLLRIFAVLFYYAIFYYITGTEFDVEAIDALDYDESAQRTAESILNGTFTFVGFLIDIKAQFDDSGYVMFLSLIYIVFNKSIIVVRLIQAIISAATVVLIYKVSKDIFDEKTAKLSAILTASFHPLLLFSALHLKETLMSYFILLFIYQCIKLVNKKVSINIVLLLAFSLLALFSFRTILGLIALLSFVGYWFLSNNDSIIKKIAFLTIGCLLGVILVINIPALDNVVYKSSKYLGIQTEGKGSGTVGGITPEQMASGQSFAKYAGGGVFLIQSLIMPYPSMVRTNIVYYDQTLQWYFAGGLFFWCFLSYYAYIGVYNSLRKQFKKSSILIFTALLYTFALIGSLYITSIRFNIVKMILLIPFIAYGIIYSSTRVRTNFMSYAIVVALIILAWNYIKLAGRGYV
ncbi:MAG: glycosyltransferase family 39 protein [Bacteroidia bacterium]